jgi:hypothetical protein
VGVYRRSGRPRYAKQKVLAVKMLVDILACLLNDYSRKVANKLRTLFLEMHFR